MERKEDTTNLLLETITKELVSIIEDDAPETNPEISKFDINQEELSEIKTSTQDYTDMCENCTISFRKETTTAPKQHISARSSILDISNICTIDDDIQKMQCNLDESCKLFQTIGERFENINFGCLKNRIKDLHLNERSADSIKIIVNDLKHSFDEKYMETRLNDLTKDMTSKFRNHPGEFGDIPEISEFFRTCTKLEQGLEKLRKQRDDCIYLQKRMTRVAEASYERMNDVQQKTIKDGGSDAEVEGNI